MGTFKINQFLRLKSLLKPIKIHSFRGLVLIVILLKKKIDVTRGSKIVILFEGVRVMSHVC